MLVAEGFLSSRNQEASIHLVSLVSCWSINGNKMSQGRHTCTKILAWGQMLHVEIAAIESTPLLGLLCLLRSTK